MNDMARLQKQRLALYGWMLAAPALALMSLFAFYPAIATFWHSLFTRGTTRRPSVFAGFENYQDLFADPTFATVVWNNLIYAGVTIPVSIIFALIMALWANAYIPARSFVRSAYFTPTILPMIAAANLWLFFYTPDLGVIDQITGFFGASP
ncbi:MAG TPA: ABC transporter permease, partial [Thalassospira sp.]|nr:ABC transporter permease [Thalassospira sp.]